MNDLNSRFENAIRWNIIAIAALTPIVMSFWHYDAFDLTKITFLYLASLVLITMTAIDKLIIKKRVEWVRTPLDLPILAFLGASTLAVIFSPAPISSFVGEYGRYETLQSFYIYAIIYQLAAQYIRSTDWLNRLLLALFAALSISVVYGILQGMNIEILPDFMLRREQRARSTMGNAVFFGTYLIIMIPILLNTLLDKKKQLIKTSTIQVWLAVLTIATLATLVLTESRGPWLGLLVGLIALGSLNAKKIKGSWQQILTFVLVGTAIAFVVLTIGTGGKPFTKVGGMVSRMGDIFTLEGSVESRLEIWKASEKMFLKSPVLGYGVDQSQFFLPKFRTLKHVMLEKGSIPDKAHNEYLQILLDSGIIGGLAFLWLLIAAGMAWRRRSDQYLFYMNGIGAAFVAYLVQAITGITMVGTMSLIAVLAGVMAALVEPDPKYMKIEFPSRVILPSLLVSIIALVSIILAYVVLMPFRADAYFYSAMKKNSSQNYGKSVLVDEIRIASSLWPYQAYYTSMWSKWLMDLAIETESSEHLKESIKAADIGIVYNPYWSNFYLGAGRAYLTLGRVQSDDSYLVRGEAYLKVKLELDPYDPQVNDSLARFYMDRARYNEAIDNLKIIVAVYPQAVKQWESLALAYESVKQLDSANQAYRKIKILDPKYLNIDENIERTSRIAVPEKATPKKPEDQLIKK